MKNNTKKMICMIMMFVMGFFAVIITKPECVKASSKPVVSGSGSKSQFMFSPEWRRYGAFVVKKIQNGAKVTVSVDKKSVASAKWDAEQKIARVTAKKPGTVNITMKIKQGGKTYSYKSTITWVKYVNPLKSLKIGQKKVKMSYFDKDTSVRIKK